METRTKVVGVIIGGGLLYAWLKPKMKIEVVKTDAELKMVQYAMKYYDYSITDTFVMGDIPNMVPMGDGVHYSLAMGNALTGIVDLSIGYLESNGGFKSIKDMVISFDSEISGIMGKYFNEEGSVTVHDSTGKYLGGFKTNPRPGGNYPTREDIWSTVRYEYSGRGIVYASVSYAGGYRFEKNIRTNKD
jgi:hypothetical protein